MSIAFPTQTLRPQTFPLRSLARPILVGGAVAGALDLTSAFITFGWRVPRGIAAGLLGRPSFTNTSPLIWALGVLLHFTIAFSAAAIYCLASKRLPFLRDHWLVCGIFYGIAVYLVMNLVVLPICALHAAGPYQLRGILQGIVAHIVLIGLPISVSLRTLSQGRALP
jgi:hypothetical protein